MAEEEKNQPAAGNEAAEEAAEPAEEAAEPEAPEGQPEAEAEEIQAGASDEVAEETAEPAAPPEPEPAASAGEAEEGGGVVEEASDEVVPDPGPKAKRRLERSRASGPPRPARTPDERAKERAEEHRASGERRRRYRAARRRKRGEPGTGTPPAPREPGPKKVRQGTVVSAGGDKTITVEIAVVRRHPTYEKVVRRTSKLHAHDEANQAQEGDVVRVVESRPLSRTKRWRLLEILEKAR
jgi:small subunit ribosomal protein S17